MDLVLPTSNHVLALALGHPPSGELPDPKLFPTYGPRARRVRLFSATPIEESYKQLWNQLDVFGRGRPFDALRTPGRELKQAHSCSRQVLVLASPVVLQ